MNRIKSLLLIITFFFVLPIAAQETGLEEIPEETTEENLELQEEMIFKRDTTKSEVHLNVLNLLIFGALDVGYERIINDHASAGVEIFSRSLIRTKVKM